MGSPAFGALDAGDDIMARLDALSLGAQHQQHLQEDLHQQQQRLQEDLQQQQLSQLLSQHQLSSRREMIAVNGAVSPRLLQMQGAQHVGALYLHEGANVHGSPGYAYGGGGLALSPQFSVFPQSPQPITTVPLAAFPQSPQPLGAVPLSSQLFAAGVFSPQMLPQSPQMVPQSSQALSGFFTPGALSPQLLPQSPMLSQLMQVQQLQQQQQVQLQLQQHQQLQQQHLQPRAGSPGMFSVGLNGMAPAITQLPQVQFSAAGQGHLAGGMPNAYAPPAQDPYTMDDQLMNQLVSHNRGITPFSYDAPLPDGQFGNFLA